jgi:glycosyltransferase involved in cell wall biosynthesis
MEQLVKEILEEEKPVLLHTHNLTGFSVSVWSVAKSLRLPLVHTVRDYSLICPRGMYKNGRNCTNPCRICWGYSRIKQQVSVIVDRVVGVSRFVLERHLAFGFFSKAHSAVVYNPVPISANTSLGTFTERGPNFRLGYLGRLAPNKGITDLLSAIESLAGTLSVELTIAGQGEKRYEEMLRRRADKLPVTFLGYVTPENLFQQIDVLVVPSRWHEPFSRVVVEAFAHGIPVIAAARGGIPEIVDDGQTGWLYDPDKPGGLVRLLVKASEERMRLYEMRRYACERVREFSIEANVAQYLKVYNSLLEGGAEA